MLSEHILTCRENAMSTLLQKIWSPVPNTCMNKIREIAMYTSTRPFSKIWERGLYIFTLKKIHIFIFGISKTTSYTPPAPLKYTLITWEWLMTSLYFPFLFYICIVLECWNLYKHNFGLSQFRLIYTFSFNSCSTKVHRLKPKFCKTLMENVPFLFSLTKLQWCRNIIYTYLVTSILYNLCVW